MSKRTTIIGALTAVLALTAGLTACSGSSSSKASSNGLPTASMMVGGIDKQIYLPYELAQGLGYYKKYGVNMELSTETQGGTGAEEAMASGQVDMAGAWYVHTIDFQQQGKDVVNLVQLSGAPGEREMCTPNSGVKSPADWAGKTVGVTDLGSGTDDLTLYLAARNHLTTKQFSRVGVGDGSTMISALKSGRVACAMTSQPGVSGAEKEAGAKPVIDLATTQGVNQWLGGFVPSAGVLARADWVQSHQAVAQKVVDALVATMHYINTHSAADIAAHLPDNYVQNGLTTKADYIKTLTEDKTQFLPDGMMPANGPQTVLAIQKLAGNIKGSVDLSKTYTNQYAIAANKLEGYKVSSSG